MSGEKSRHDALLPAPQKMTGNVIYMGEAPERAAAFMTLSQDFEPIGNRISGML